MTYDKESFLIGLAIGLILQMLAVGSGAEE